MDALLLKTNHRGTSMMREENRKIKREENLRRTKQARGISVQDKRKIPENLEITNESIHAPTITKKKPIRQSSNKPSRIELLREWRAKKMSEKASLEKNKKAPFVVKHIVYKDSQKGKENKEDCIKKSTQIPSKKIDSNLTQRSQRVLRERNANVTYNVSKQPQVVKPVQKQSYNEWKKSQIQENQKPVTRSTKSTTLENKQNKCPSTKQQVKDIRTRPTTRSMKMNKNESVSDQNKTKTVNKKTSKKTEEEKCKNEEEEKDISKKDESIIKESDVKENEQKDNDNEINATPKKFNIFSVLSSSKTEEFSYTTHEHPIEPLVTEKTEFLPPQELFTDFKFDQKVILEAITDFVPATSNPAEAKLFTTDITAIEKKDSDNEDEKEAVKLLAEDCNAVKLDTKTPISTFQEREGLLSRKTPTSTPKRLSKSSGKRSSFTPNPMNFLHKNEDPVALKSETPKVSQKPHSRVSKVLSVDIQEDQQESETVRHFTNLVSTEEAKFKLNLDKWEQILEEKSAPEEYQGNILAAIGQAQLFMRKRFNQFKELINLHKDKTAEKAAHASDLDGFWEMIYYQVSDVHKRFDELNKLEEKQWIVEQPQQEAKKKIVKKTKTKNTVATNSTASKGGASKRSEFAKFRQQMMAKKKAEEQQVVGDFVKILTPVRGADKATLAPLRRSIRNLPDTPKDASNVCLIFPVANNTTETENIISDPAPVQKEPTPSPPKSETKSIEKEGILNPIRRSTRKTPSKYSSINFTDVPKKPEDVACNLFEMDEQDINGSEVTKCPSKTLLSGRHVQRDLLTSFNTPKMDKTKPKNPSVVSNDLMMFESPFAQQYLVKKSDSDVFEEPNVGDLLL